MGAAIDVYVLRRVGRKDIEEGKRCCIKNLHIDLFLCGLNGLCR